jgi:hypothetical protein
MATVPYTMQPAVLTGAVATYVTTPVNQYFTSKKVTVSNTSASAVTLTIYKVPSGGTAGVTNLLIGALTIPGNTVNGGVKEIYEAENQIFQAGDTLQALAGTAAVLNLNVSGIMQTT